MTVIVANPSEREARREEKAMRSASKRILSTKESAKAYLLKNGFITKTGKLAKRYGG